MKKTVITYGTFDMFHIGHLRLLQRAAALGDELIVAVSTEEFNKLTGKKVIIPFEQRIEIVKNITCVSKVTPEYNWEQKISDIQLYDVDTFAIGDDWKGKFDSLKQFCNVVYLERTSGISTSSLKSSLSRILSANNQS